jgi:hypothetical protein
MIILPLQYRWAPFCNHCTNYQDLLQL